MSNLIDLENRPPDPEWTAYIVNLRGDSDRWLRLQEALTHFPWLRTIRIEGVYGSALPNDVCQRLTNDPYSVIAKGALGCLLSHVRAWELIVSGSEQWVLVLEDDVHINEIEFIRTIKFGDEIEFVFANDRTQRDLSNPEMCQSLFAPVVHSLHSIDHRKKAVGTDCYLISKSGAARMIGLFKSHGYFGHVDMRLIAYAVSESALSSLAPDSWLNQGIKQIKRVTGEQQDLKAFTLCQPVGIHEAGPSTTRTREDFLGSKGTVYEQK